MASCNRRLRHRNPLSGRALWRGEGRHPSSAGFNSIIFGVSAIAPVEITFPSFARRASRMPPTVLDDDLMHSSKSAIAPSTFPLRMRAWPRRKYASASVGFSSIALLKSAIASSTAALHQSAPSHAQNRVRPISDSTRWLSCSPQSRHRNHPSPSGRTRGCKIPLPASAPQRTRTTQGKEPIQRSPSISSFFSP